MSVVKTHKDLDIWKRGIAFVEQIYKITGKFPKEELYGLTSQIRRSAVSYPSNIAEGAARSSKKEYIQFLYFALASLSEVETQLIIAEKLGYLSANNLLEEVEALRRMSLNFIKYLKSENSKEKE
ncbi:MAG: four helix bundle protein [Planctomycetota bacterium]|jgi:four helix bundle protein